MIFRGWISVGLCLSALCAMPGCRSALPSGVPRTPYVLDPPQGSVPGLDPAGARTVSIRDAIHHALLTDPAVNELAARHRRAAGDLEAIHPESPEIRAGYERSRDSRRGSSFREEWGGASRTGEQRTLSTGSRSTERREVSAMDRGDLWETDQTSVADSSTRESERSSAQERSRSDAAYAQVASGSDDQLQREDVSSIELRLHPPNPWALGAARQGGRAVLTVIEAELLAQEYWLACDIVESSLQLFYYRRMVRLQTVYSARALRMRLKLQAALESGSLSSKDYAESCRLAADALARQCRMEAKVAEIERELRARAGVDPARLELETLEHALITPFAIPRGADGDARLAASLTASHAAVISARWNRIRSEADWAGARAAGIPWATDLAVGYAWREGRREGARSFEGSGTETRLTGSQSSMTETSTSETLERETESPSGDNTERRESGQQSVTARSDSDETEYEESFSTGNEVSHSRNDGQEWWVAVGVEIPVFEWFSGETRIRRQAAWSARKAEERVAQRVHADILAALRTVRLNQQELCELRDRFGEEIPALRNLAAAALRQGFAGELEALRIMDGVAEMGILFLERSLQEALGRVELVRVVGCFPSVDASGGVQGMVDK